MASTQTKSAFRRFLSGHSVWARRDDAQRSSAGHRRRAAGYGRSPARRHGSVGEVGEGLSPAPRPAIRDGCGGQPLATWLEGHSGQQPQLNHEDVAAFDYRPRRCAVNGPKIPDRAAIGRSSWHQRAVRPMGCLNLGWKGLPREPLPRWRSLARNGRRLYAGSTPARSPDPALGPCRQACRFVRESGSGLLYYFGTPPLQTAPSS